jgi:D-alanine-D-alanine ligase
MNSAVKTIFIAVDNEKNSRKDIRDVLRCKDAIKNVLTKAGFRVKVLAITKDAFKNIRALKEKISGLKCFCVFNLFEGFSQDSGKEACFVKIMEELGIKFTGNSSLALNSCLDKAKVKEILMENNLPTPQGILIKKIGGLNINKLHFPLFIKPRFEDASLGIDNDSFVTDENKLFAALEDKLERFKQGLILEEFIGGDEYSISFLGSRILGISKISYNRYRKLMPFLTYNAKWKNNSFEYQRLMPVCTVDLEEKLKQRIIYISKKAASLLGCRSYFRLDLRQKGGEFFILDVNPNPDINVDSGFIKQAAGAGFSYTKVIKEILRLALS